jgi:hypothetical protein
MSGHSPPRLRQVGPDASEGLPSQEDAASRLHEYVVSLRKAAGELREQARNERRHAEMARVRAAQARNLFTAFSADQGVARARTTENREAADELRRRQSPTGTSARDLDGRVRDHEARQREDEANERDQFDHCATLRDHAADLRENAADLRERTADERDASSSRSLGE